MANSTEQTTEQDIADLERKLAEKKASLEKTGDTIEKAPSEKEILHEAVGEKIRQQIPVHQPAPGQSSTSSDASGDASYNLPELHDSVQELVSLVFSKGLNDAISSLRQKNNPALVDAFHDAIVDELFEEMIQRNIIPLVK